MGLFKKKTASSPESPATLNRAVELLPALGYELNSSDSHNVYLTLPSCETVIRRTGEYIELLGGTIEKDKTRDQATEWVENFNAHSFVPTMLVVENNETQDLHVYGTFRIPTAWDYTDEQLAEQLKTGLEAITKSIDGYRKGYEV